MDSAYGKFGDCTSAVIVLSCTQTNTQTDTDERFTATTFVGESKYQCQY